jgi:hypothetical protein
MGMKQGWSPFAGLGCKIAQQRRRLIFQGETRPVVGSSSYFIPIPCVQVIRLKSRGVPVSFTIRRTGVCAESEFMPLGGTS